MPPFALGLVIVTTAALFQGSFAVPMAYARNWKWEHSWMAFSVLGMILFNLAAALATVPGLFEVYRTAPPGSLVVPLAFGLLWGLGAVTFGLGIATVGLALGYAIMLGMVLGMGAFVPLAVLHPSDIAAPKGIVVMIGLAVTIAGIALSGAAGLRREREQGRVAGEITRDARFSMKTGIAICVFSGLCSSSINIGFALSGPLLEHARASGVPANWAGNVVWVVLFVSGGILNILYCARLMMKNRSAHAFLSPGSARSLGLIALMSVMWIGSFIAYGAGATVMGGWGTVIGWSVYMSLSIAAANAWGIVQGEWRGVSLATKRIVTAGALVLFAAILVFAYGGTMG